MVTIMGLLIANKVLFMHNHLLPDGRVITHAHPFNKSGESAPYKQHQHSRTEFFFIQHLDLLFVFILLIIAGHRIFQGIIKTIPPDVPCYNEYLAQYQGRAPPAL